MSPTRECRHCGAVVPEENAFCTSCGASVTFRPPSQELPTPPTATMSPARAQPVAQPRALGSGRIGSNGSGPSSGPTPVTGIGVTPTDNVGMGGIGLAHGEVVKRVYELGRIQRVFGWVQGTLVVTDVRVLYRAEASNKLNRSTLNKEIHLNEVRGIGLATRRGMSAAGLGAWILGSLLTLGVVLFVGAGVSAASTDAFGNPSGSSSGWTIVLLILWAALVITIFVLRRRASVVILTVFASDINSSPIEVTGVVGRNGTRGFLAFLASPLILLLERLGIIEAEAAAESADIDSIREVYAELGAVITDLQSRGSYGAD